MTRDRAGELSPRAAAVVVVDHIRADGGDDWLGPIKVERVDRPSLGSDPAAGPRTGRPQRLGPVGRRERSAPGLPARHGGRADPGRQRADRPSPPDGPPGRTLPSWSASTRGRSSHGGRCARRRRWRSSSPPNTTGLTSKPAFLSLGLLKDASRASTLRALGVGGARDAGRHHPALDRRDRRPGARGRPAAARADDADGDEKAEPKTTKKTVAAPAGRRRWPRRPRPPGAARRRACRPSPPPSARSCGSWPRPRTGVPEGPRSAGRRPCRCRSSRRTSSSMRS